MAHNWDDHYINYGNSRADAIVISDSDTIRSVSPLSGASDEYRAPPDSPYNPGWSRSPAMDSMILSSESEFESGVDTTPPTIPAGSPNYDALPSPPLTPVGDYPNYGGGRGPDTSPD